MDEMREHSHHNIICSISTIEYSNPAKIQISNACLKVVCTNHYCCKEYTSVGVDECVDGGWNVVILKYFRPINANHVGTIGENSNGYS